MKMWGIIVLIALSGCVENQKIVAGTVTSSHLYLHQIKLEGKRGQPLNGYKCTERPLFFSQDNENMEKTGIMGIVQKANPDSVGAEKIAGTLWTKNYGLWTEKCAIFSSITPILK